ERAKRVRDQERDLEGVDRADGAEVVARDDLPDEAEDPRESGREREDRRRACEAARAPRLGRGGALLSRAHRGERALWTKSSRDCPSCGRKVPGTVPRAGTR